MDYITDMEHATWSNHTNITYVTSVICHEACYQVFIMSRACCGTHDLCWIQQACLHAQLVSQYQECVCVCAGPDPGGGLWGLQPPLLL